MKKVIDAIVSIHETGKIPSDAAYSTVTVLKDGAGISYGKHQATDKSGSLDAVVMAYADHGGLLAPKLIPYLDELEKNLTTTLDAKNLPAWTKGLMTLLAEAGADPIMRKAQDEVFDRLYWKPSTDRCADMKLVLPLSYLAIYDTAIHSGPGRIDTLRKVFPEVPPSRGGDERKWTTAFIRARRAWLASHSNPLVRTTVYRCDGMLDLINNGNWQLTTPLKYKGITIP